MAPTRARRPAPRRRLTPRAAQAVCAVLNSQHIPVDCARRAGTVHVWPEHKLSTPEEVTVLRAFKAVTDCPIAWHASRPSDIDPARN